MGTIIENDALCEFISKVLDGDKNAEQIAKDFIESKKFEHKFCYRVYVKSFYERGDADRVEEKFGVYERVFTEKSDADWYMVKVKADLKVLGYHPFESAYKFYDCAVMDSALLLNWNNVRFW